MAEVREITRSARTCASSAIRASVMPSAKYSCSGSPERLASGSTARAWMRPAAGWRILGDCYLKLKRYPDATNAFQKALQLDNNKFASNFGLALAYYNSEKYRDAIATLGRAERLARTPKDQYQVYRTRGSAYFNLQAFDEAAADIAKANSIQRANYQDSLQLGIAYYNTGKVEEADRFLRQALALNGSSAEAKKYLAQMGYARAISAIDKKDFAGATSLLRQHLAEHYHMGHTVQMNPGSLTDWPLTEQRPLFKLHLQQRMMKLLLKVVVF